MGYMIRDIGVKNPTRRLCPYMTPLKNPHISIPEEEDEDFDFEEPMREIHTELKSLNDEAVVLSGKIKKIFEELGI